ncbi:hypothetical protein D9M68_709970 [compost metagenome]
MVQRQQSRKIGIGLQQQLVPGLALAAGIGKYNGGAALVDDRHHLIHQPCTEMSCPGQYLHLIREHRYNFYLLFLFGNNFLFAIGMR